MKKEYVPIVKAAVFVGIVAICMTLPYLMKAQVVNLNGAGPQAQGTAVDTNPPANPTNSYGGNQRIQAEVFWLDGTGNFDGWQPAAGSNWGVTGSLIASNGLRVPTSVTFGTTNRPAWNGRVQLTNGVATITNNPSVTTNDTIFLTQEETPTGAAGAMLEITNKAAGYFQIMSLSNGVAIVGATYTNWVDYFIVQH